MMNWIIGAVIAVVVVGGGYIFMSGGYSMEEKQMVGEAGDVNGDGSGDAIVIENGKATPKLMEKAAGFTGSWNDIVKRGGNYVCEVNHSSSVDISSGKVYVSGTNVRGEFVSKTAAGSVASNMLKKGDTVYVWGGGMPQGMMMKATEMERQGAPTGTSDDVVDQNQAYDWNCSATGADASMFELPKGIEFMDLSAMMQGMGAVPTTGR